jgi:hypothetical protein
MENEEIKECEHEWVETDDLFDASYVHYECEICGEHK